MGKRYRNLYTDPPWEVQAERVYFGRADKHRTCPGCGRKIRATTPVAIMDQEIRMDGRGDVYRRWWHIDCARSEGYAIEEQEDE